MADAVLLDLDRTLVDLQSFTDYDAAWADVRPLVPPDLQPAGPSTTWLSATRACMGVLAALPAGVLWHEVSGLVAKHERAAIALATPMPGVHEFLAALEGTPLAVVTLLPVDVARDVLARNGIDIPVIVGRDPDIRPKPAGDGLLMALARLGIEPAAAVMVGDSSWDAAAAASAGVRFVGVTAHPGEFARDVPVRGTLSEVLPLLSELD